ncbi:site-2 protease family protein [Candidatus Omnitrophota bacterium]
MRGSIKLFTLFGIAIRIHLTFLLLPLIVFITFSQEYGGYIYGLRGIFVVFLVFCCVVFHELSHSLQARRFGIGVEQIILLPIGGIAGMKSIPEKPSEEFKISLAGPAFNIILAIVLFLPAYYLLGPENLFRPGVETWIRTFAYAFWINIMLAIFNLLPAFPMDGGRILRAFLASRMEYVKATRIAVGFGHTFAVLFGFWGLTSFNPILIIIAFFIFMAASSEGMQVELRSTLGRFSVKDVLPEQFTSITSVSPLSQVLSLTLHSHQEDFPVVDEGRLVGLLTRADIILAVQQAGMQQLTRNVMKKEFPVVQLSDSLTKAHKLMEQWRIKAVPVINRGQVIGIISLEDISRAYLLMSGRR